MEKNYGIKVTGGRVEAGAMAAGDHATATNVSAASTASFADARAGMAQLIEELRAQSGKLERPEETLAMAELADLELGKDKPDKGKILRLLDLIASAAKSIASIGGAVTAIQQAVTAIL